MINICEDDLKDLEKIGHGTFGCVYKKNDEIAYKIYYKNIKNYSGFCVNNPCLTLPKWHFYLLKSRLSKTKNIEGIKDLIYVNGSFGGVSIPYYEGITLNNIMNYPLKLKIELSKQIVTNSKELTKKLIYKTDHKLNNMILSNNEVKFIDLDDVENHTFFVPDLLFKYESINGIGETIQTFLNMYDHFFIPINISKELLREKSFYSSNYNKIDNYITNIEKEKNIIFINDETDISKLKELINNNNFNVVYVIEKKQDSNYYLQIINKLKEENIQLFDFLNIDNINNYSSIENVNESYLLSKKELVIIPQKN